MKISSKFSLALLAGTILSTPTMAAEEKEITVDYLNSLTGPKVTWSESEGTYQINLAGKTWYYDYNKPEGYTDAADRIDYTLNSANVTNVVFEGMTANFGGAIDNAEYNGDINITADFIRNRGSYWGGAIYNRGTIGDIAGNFIGNYSTGGEGEYGGAIDNRGAIGDITGDFIGNYAVISGAIDNSGTIGDITGDFIGNYAVIGGAINNNFTPGIATIGDITGDFIGNYAQSENDLAFGGAIVNQFGNFNITGNILNNYAQSEKGTAYGGAIVSSMGVDENTLEVTASSVSSKGEDIFLSGNYTEDTRGKIYNALHVMILPEEQKEHAGIPADAVDFAFDTTGGGSITINDNIDGSLTDISNVFFITDDRSAQYNLAFRGERLKARP